jgi:hypothetical protein
MCILLLFSSLYLVLITLLVRSRAATTTSTITHFASKPVSAASAEERQVSSASTPVGKEWIPS